MTPPAAAPINAPVVAPRCVLGPMSAQLERRRALDAAARVNKVDFMVIWDSWQVRLGTEVLKGFLPLKVKRLALPFIHPFKFGI